MNHSDEKTNAKLIAGELAKCVKCGKCMFSCPLYSITKSETAGMRGKAALLQAALKGREMKLHDLSELLFKCTLCLKCAGECPNGVDTELILRRWFVSGFRNYGAEEMLTLRLLKSSRISAAVTAVAVGLVPGNAVLGEHLRREFKSLIRMEKEIALMNDIGQNVLLVHDSVAERLRASKLAPVISSKASVIGFSCCETFPPAGQANRGGNADRGGDIFHDIGTAAMLEILRLKLQSLYSSLSERNIGKLIVACPRCYDKLRRAEELFALTGDESEFFGKIHDVYSWLASENSEPVKTLPGSARLHLPTVFRREAVRVPTAETGNSIHSAIFGLIRNLGVESNPEVFEPCGGDLVIHYGNERLGSDLTRALLAKAAEARTDNIIVADERCRKALAGKAGKLGVGVIHLLDLFTV